MNHRKIVIGLCAVAFTQVRPAHAVVRSPEAIVAKVKKSARAALPEAVEGEFVVKLASSGDCTLQSVSVLFAPLGMSVKETINARENLFLVKARSVAALAQVSIAAYRASMVRTLENQPGVEFAEPNFIYRAFDDTPSDIPSVTPNDPRFGALWGMKNTGQKDKDGTVGKVGADIKATQAWALAKGSKDVVVAVVDTGVDYTHPDLKDNIWSMPGKPEVHGYNAVTGKEDPMDDNEHGTHCSGTIGGSGDNGVGVTGVNWNVSIMGSKFLSASGGGTLADAIKAIDWATDHGAQVMSNSWGGGGRSEALLDAIKRAAAKGIVFVAAASNDSSDNDAQPSYPASYAADVDNVIAVAASTNTDGLASFSNYGAKTVHLMAPGHNILSSTPGNNYKVFSGTSMAAPHVSGAVALLLSREPGLTPAQVRDRLMSSADKIPAMRRKLISGGRLNVYNLIAGITPPGFVTIPDNAWSSPAAQSAATAHPYANGAKQSWTFEHPGAQYIRVHFKKFSTEQGYDVVKLISKTGEVVDTLSGQLPDNSWSVEVEGDRVEVQFSSDNSVGDYGFDIDSFSWVDHLNQ